MTPRLWETMRTLLRIVGVVAGLALGAWITLCGVVVVDSWTRNRRAWDADPGLASHGNIDEPTAGILVIAICLILIGLAAMSIPIWWWARAARSRRLRQRAPSEASGDDGDLR